MYVVVWPKGVIAFRYDYRLASRRETLTLGQYDEFQASRPKRDPETIKYGDPLSLADARELLMRLKALLVLNWRQKSAARSQLKLAIEDTLDSGLPRAYTPDLYRQKCSAVFEHVYESYPERGAGVYAG